MSNSYTVIFLGRKPSSDVGILKGDIRKNIDKLRRKFPDAATIGVNNPEFVARWMHPESAKWLDVKRGYVFA